jgi:hypothetical protein
MSSYRRERTRRWYLLKPRIQLLRPFEAPALSFFGLSSSPLSPGFRNSFVRQERGGGRQFKLYSICVHLSSAEHAGVEYLSKEFCRCTALDSHRRLIRTRARSRSIARDPNDLMLVTAIRAAVYLAEQDCPIEEEFDGNDLVAARLPWPHIAHIGSVPRMNCSNPRPCR